jgi:hypothetical protein
MKKLIGIVLYSCSLISPTLQAQFPRLFHLTHTQSIPNQSYKKSAVNMLTRFDFKLSSETMNFLQERITAIQSLLNTIKDNANALSTSVVFEQKVKAETRYASTHYWEEHQLPHQESNYEDCFLWTLADYAEEYTKAQIRLIYSFQEKHFHIGPVELRTILDELPIVEEEELDLFITQQKITNDDIKLILIYSLGMLAQSILDAYHDKHSTFTSDQTPSVGSAKKETQIN